MRRTIPLLVLSFSLAACGGVPDRDWPGTTASPEERYTWSREVIQHQARAERWWWWSWTLTYSGLVAYQGITAIVADGGDRTDAIVSGTGSLVGLTRMLLRSPRAIRAEAELAELPDGLPLEARADYAEDLLGEVAEGQHFMRQAWIFLTGLATSTTLATILWVGFDRRLTASRNFFFGAIISGTQFITKPFGAARVWPGGEYEVRVEPTGITIHF